MAYENVNAFHYLLILHTQSRHKPHVEVTHWLICLRPSSGPLQNQGELLSFPVMNLQLKSQKIWLFWSAIPYRSVTQKPKIWLLVTAVRGKRLHISFKSTHFEIWRRKCAEIRPAPVTSLQSISSLVHELHNYRDYCGLFFSLPSLTNRHQGH